MIKNQFHIISDVFMCLSYNNIRRNFEIREVLVKCLNLTRIRSRKHDTFAVMSESRLVEF